MVAFLLQCWFDGHLRLLVFVRVLQATGSQYSGNLCFVLWIHGAGFGGIVYHDGLRWSLVVTVVQQDHFCIHQDRLKRIIRKTCLFYAVLVATIAVGESTLQRCRNSLLLCTRGLLWKLAPQFLPTLTPWFVLFEVLSTPVQQWVETYRVSIVPRFHSEILSFSTCCHC